MYEDQSICHATDVPEIVIVLFSKGHDRSSLVMVPEMKEHSCMDGSNDTQQLVP